MEVLALAAVGAAFALVALFRSRAKKATALQAAVDDAIARKVPASEMLDLAALCRAAGDLDSAHKLESVVAGVSP